MTTTKMTYAIALSTAINALSADAQYNEVCEKLNALSETLAKRNANKGERKPTKVQRENEAVKAQILEYMNEPKSASEVAEIMELSVQKVSALLNQMVADKVLTKTPAKGKTKTTFVVASEVEAE